MRLLTTLLISFVAFVCLVLAIGLGAALRRFLPEDHLSADSKEVVKLAMGLVATMAALILGLLVSSAKSAYDTKRSEIIQVAAKLTFLDRLLNAYGPEADKARADVREATRTRLQRILSLGNGSASQSALQTEQGNQVYAELEGLSPHDEMQRGLKARAIALATDLGELQSLLLAQSVGSISIPLLIVVVSWLVIILFSFTLLAPPNTTTIFALVFSALSLAGAIFLILDLDRPFAGITQLPREPMLRALNDIGK